MQVLRDSLVLVTQPRLMRENGFDTPLLLLTDRWR